MDWFNAGLRAPLEVAIRVALKRDAATLARIGRMEGKAITLCLRHPALTLTLLPHGEGIDLRTDYEEPVDCRIEADLSDLVELMQDEQRTFGSGVMLSGDAGLARELKACLLQLDLDWEGLLGDRIGDLLAHPLAEFVRRGRRFVRQTADSLADDIDDYLHEEVRLVPTRVELEHHYGQIDRLRLDVDRLQARVERLAAALAPESDQAQT